MGVLIAKATLTIYRYYSRGTAAILSMLLRGSQYVVHVTGVCRTRSTSRLSRPGGSYLRSEGSGATFEVYLGIATAAIALRAELEDIQTQFRHHSLRVSVEFLAAHWR